MFKRTLSALGAAALMGTVALAAPLHAAEPSVSVSYGDLNLAKNQDVARFERRVTRAAAALCNAGSIDPSAKRWASACQSDVLANAKDDVDNAVISARTGTVRVLALRR